MERRGRTSPRRTSSATCSGPALIGKPLAPIEAHATEFDRILRGNWFTKAGVNTALWDALGRTRGVTVAELLGGPHRREVPVKISLSGDGDELRAGYETAAGLGFRAFKVKVGRDPDADVARVALARELAGDEAFLGADANGGWPLDVALATVPRLAESRHRLHRAAGRAPTTSRGCARCARSASR